MSKTKGNGIDPREMIAKYGTDPLRLSLVIGSSPGEKLRLYEEKIATYKNFVTKVWNSVRFALMYTNSNETTIDNTKLNIQDKWILSECQNLINSVTENLESYRFSDARNQIYNFLRNKLCDWYLEMSKVETNSAVVLHVIDACLKLLHPFTPMATTKLYSYINENELMLESWPEVKTELIFEEAKEMEKLIQTVTAIRRIKKEFDLQTDKQVPIKLQTQQKYIIESLEVIKKLSNSENIELSNNSEKLKLPSEHLSFATDIYLKLENLNNIQEQVEKTEKQLNKIEKQLTNFTNKLSNKKFTDNAPGDIIEKVETEKDKAQELLNNLIHKLNVLKECL